MEKEKGFINKFCIDNIERILLDNIYIGDFDDILQIR